MSVQICLEKVVDQCSYVPLAVMGYCLTKTGCLQTVLDSVQVEMKSYQHTPTQKLQDILVAIMAGCRSLAQVNTRIRPEQALAQAWQRPVFAEQSTLSRLLDSLGRQQVDQLRAANTTLLKQHSQLLCHDWQQAIVLDIDPTSLLTSKKAEGSRKGWVSGKRNRYCRHVIRFTLAGYHESLISLVYPGNRHGYEYCKPAFQQLLQLWPDLLTHASQVIVRSDAEQGTDANLSYILWLGFQLLMKGYSGRRTNAWVKQISPDAWKADPDGRERWMTMAPKQLRLGRHTDCHLLRWYGQKRQLSHATLHTTLAIPCFKLWNFYDQRAVTEIEIRNDKSGLALHLRRKQSLNAQEAWIVLTDIAHNLLAWLRPWMLAGTNFANFGSKRIVNELLNIPGHIYIENGQLQKVTLWQSHPYASEMRLCLEKLLKTFDLY